MTETSHTGAATIDREYRWRPIDAYAPLGTKVQLINRRDGVATYGLLFSHNSHWTHWAPLPTFAKEIS